jgi:hypothetical protein
LALEVSIRQAVHLPKRPPLHGPVAAVGSRDYSTAAAGGSPASTETCRRREPAGGKEMEQPEHLMPIYILSLSAPARDLPYMLCSLPPPALPRRCWFWADYISPQS